MLPKARLEGKKLATGGVMETPVPESGITPFERPEKVTVKFPLDVTAEVGVYVTE